MIQWINRKVETMTWHQSKLMRQIELVVLAFAYIWVVYLLIVPMPYEKDKDLPIYQEYPTRVFTPSPADLKCLSLNVYFEARNQKLEGQEAVAWVTMNRVLATKYPNNICDVVWQPGQFSWTEDGKSDKPLNRRAWEKAIQIALSVYYFAKMELFEFDPTKGSIMYHTTQINPYWSDSYAYAGEIGNHLFYK